MSHPSTAVLVELHFGERQGPEAEAGRAHVRDCAACAAVFADLRWAEDALAAVPAPDPPADGLERVLARVGSVRPAGGRRSGWVRTTVPSVAVALAGGVAVQQGGAVAALAFFVLGSIVTLAIAPVLILESQRRSP